MSDIENISGPTGAIAFERLGKHDHARNRSHATGGVARQSGSAVSRLDVGQIRIEEIDDAAHLHRLDPNGNESTFDRFLLRQLS